MVPAMIELFIYFLLYANDFVVVGRGTVGVLVQSFVVIELYRFQPLEGFVLSC